ncbi:hypothetical protein T05_8003 [Trichinella murrelli]|uniref:Uncharacterized protein n=1 Tax=Trichinella murrelli TaxID=144512 RepID=A0A0V0SS30_9BILA|nr:hypothetical protein T05_8003 [Trichinella murrelli]
MPLLHEHRQFQGDSSLMDTHPVNLPWNSGTISALGF